MTSPTDSPDKYSYDKFMEMQSQLSLARSEISNLRKEIKNWKYSYHREIDELRSCLEKWRCPKCRTSETCHKVDTPAPIPHTAVSEPQEEKITLQPIGLITTGFARKQAVPRQSNLNLSSHAKITLHNHVFTNPEHSLQGLEGFSHMWVLFFFHQNMSNHIRAKVAPPRLNGARVGVFGTRSPHRPCPIGLSLVQIDKIEGCSIYFSGVDMVDGTPVLDLKPYIPHYDNPSKLNLECSDTDTDTLGMERLELDGQESDFETLYVPTPQASTSKQPTPTRPTEREAPDGEEGELEEISSHTTLYSGSTSPVPSQRHVRVPEWIAQSSVSQLQVSFTPHAEAVLRSLQEDDITRIITDILREDPRSVYLRDRYANQFYTFLIHNFHVSCKFDDSSHSVKVFRVVPAGKLCECDQPEWQCSIHGGAGSADL